MRRERGGGGGEGGGRGEKHKTEQQNGHLGYFVVFFGPIETICFLLVFCIIRCIPWNFRPSIPNTSSLFYRMLQGENNDFPPKKGLCNMLASFDVLNCTHEISMNMGSFDVAFTPALQFWIPTRVLHLPPPFISF